MQTFKFSAKTPALTQSPLFNEIQKPRMSLDWVFQLRFSKQNGSQESTKQLDGRLVDREKNFIRDS